jgi:single-strand DNA-binding protein
MANETIVTITGNLVDIPGVRYTASGAVVGHFVVASTPRIVRNGEWVDGDTLFLRCNVWREQAEHASKSLSKGDRVMVTGKLRMHSYIKDDERRTSIELDVDEVGASLRYATAKVVKSVRNGTNSHSAGEAEIGERG